MIHESIIKQKQQDNIIVIIINEDHYRMRYLLEKREREQ